MIKPNELRIGNICRNTRLKDDYITIDEYDIFMNSAVLIPIPLTEEWLLKFGFAQIGVNYQLNHFPIWWSDYAQAYKIRYYYTGSEFEKTVNLEYVHQLQNLYFALENEELTIQS